jgi:hypothetical protein
MHMEMELQEQEERKGTGNRKRKKEFLKFSKFDENYKPRGLRSSMNAKCKKMKNYTKGHPN